MLTEFLLLQALLNKAPNAYETFYDKYSSLIYGYICRASLHPETCEKILQDVFKSIWQNLHLYDSSKCRLFTWIYKITQKEINLYPKSNYEQSAIILNKPM